MTEAQAIEQVNDRLGVLLRQMTLAERIARFGDDAMLVAQDIADLLGYEKSTVQQTILCRPDFPRAYLIPTSGDKTGKRYRLGEVKQWALRYRDPGKR